MSYVIKSYNRYVCEDNRWTFCQQYATKFATKRKAAAASRSVIGVVLKLVPHRSRLTRAVAKFQAMIGEPAPSKPKLASLPVLAERFGFINSEVIELDEAIAARDFVEIVDALADIAYFVEGTFQRLGVNSGPIMAEVHRSNMAKRGAGKDKNGKWQKPKGWTPPDIAGELRKQGWKGGL